MSEEELTVALVQITATLERGRFWLRLRFVDGLEPDAVRHAALATSVTEACEIIQYWLRPLEQEANDLNSDTTRRPPSD